MSTITKPVTTGSAALGRKKSSRPVWEEEPGPAAKIGKAAVLTMVVIAVLGPLYSIVLTSLSSQDTITSAGGMVIVPGGISLDAYQQIMSGGVVTRAVLVSVGVTAVGTILSMVVSVLCAYGLSRPGSFAHTPLLFTLLLTMFFSAGMIPAFLLVSGLGLISVFIYSAPYEEVRLKG